MTRRNTSASIAALVFAYVLAPTSFVPAAAASFGQPQDLNEITAIENELAGATEIDKIMPHFAENAILADIATPGWYVGRKQIYAAVQPQVADLRAIKYRMDEISVASDGKFACAAMQIHFDAAKKDNSVLNTSIRQLDAFKKIDGHWLIIQQQLSVPVDQKTATPVFDAAVTSRGPLPWSEASAIGPAIPVEQAKKEIMTWLTASEIPKSIDEMAGYYGPGDDNIIFDWWSSHEVRGRKEIHDYYGPSFVGVRNMEIKIPVVSIDTDGEFGVQISQQHLKMNMNDGTAQLISFRQSDCVRRVGNKWYSFFEMGSFPVDTKTGKAVMMDAAAFK